MGQACADIAPQRRFTPSQREAVERAEAYQRAHMDASVPLADLCRLVRLSERGLRKAFYRVRGISPKRCLAIERLLSAREALRNSGTRPMTVTRAAVGSGFYELGRFAAIYRKAFGEPPSATLRSSRLERDAAS